MGAVKAFLMDMEDYAFSCLEDADLNQKEIDWARDMFLRKYPNQHRVFNNVVEEYLDFGISEMMDPQWLDSTTRQKYYDTE